MGWLGWVIAAIAIGVVVRLRRQLSAERAHGNDLVCERLEADNRLEALTREQSGRIEVSVFTGMADDLDGDLQAATDQLRSADSALEDYRECVRQFDAAVQYCLQPVELIFGADKANLDQLVHHVEGARRKLFEARSRMEKHPLHKAKDVLDGALGSVQALARRSAEFRAKAVAPPPPACARPARDVDARAAQEPAEMAPTAR